MPDTVSGLIRRAAAQLSLRGIAMAALDARLLLQASAGMSQADVVAEPDLILAPEVVDGFWSRVERRSAFEPVSRILGHREFYGREFQVTPAVLDPRADTETLIAAALPLGQGKPTFRVLDLGTGSGAIAVTLLAELPDATGVATDVSEAALAVARANTERHGVSERLALVKTSWFSGLSGKFDLIVSNPPYIPTTDVAGLAPDVRDFDPLGALDGGGDGLAAYRQIASEVGAYLKEEGQVMLEIGAGQELAVQGLFEARGLVPGPHFTDLGGHIRVLSFNLPR